MPEEKRVRKRKLVLLILLITFSLTSCQAFVANSNQSLPSTEPAKQTATLAPSANIFWVDTTNDLGKISPFVLGANHGPWSDLGIGNLESAGKSGITFLRWPGGDWGDQNDATPISVDTYIGEARKIIHAEPSITVRLLGSTPGQAAQLVRYVNIDKGYGVKYW